VVAALMTPALDADESGGGPRLNVEQWSAFAAPT
jgi:hypothetical protein